MSFKDEIRRERPIKGRGALSNASGRHERETRHAMDDGWGRPSPPMEEGHPPERSQVATRVLIDASKSVIARNRSPDIPYEQSINPYRGCEHGCVYCYARPSHAWLGLSAGLDFETTIFAKPDAPALLETALQNSRYRCRPIALGSNTDPYQPAERRLKITRGILEVLSAFNHPVTIITKSDAVLADRDLLASMARRNLVHVALSITTLDAELARSLEPRAATPARRLKAIAALAEASVPVGCMVAPVIPALTDWELERILQAAGKAGARRAGTLLLRLPLEVEGLFIEWLQSHVPDRADHVLNRIRDLRGGRLNQSEFGLRMRGEGPFAALLAQRFRLARKRYGLDDNPWPALDTTRFRPPAAAGTQLSLL